MSCDARSAPSSLHVCHCLIEAAHIEDRYLTCRQQWVRRFLGVIETELAKSTLSPGS